MLVIPASIWANLRKMSEISYPAMPWYRTWRMWEIEEEYRDSAPHLWAAGLECLPTNVFSYAGASNTHKLVHTLHIIYRHKCRNKHVLCVPNFTYIYIHTKTLSHMYRSSTFSWSGLVLCICGCWGLHPSALVCVCNLPQTGYSA